MRIFLEVAKKIIIDKATAISEASRLADLSTINYARSMVGHGRNTKLSAEKRLLIDRLLPQIKSLTDGDDDSATLKNLKELITMCLNEVAEASLRNGHTRGDTERGLESLEALVQLVFNKLHALQLLEIPHDDAPLNRFRYYAALYCAQKIADRHDLGLWGQLALHPKVSPKMGFAVEQEKLVVDAINECIADVAAFDVEHPRYKQANQRLVLLSIESLHHANVALCARHTSVPIPGITFLQPDDGFLEECLQNAIREITTPANSPAMSHAAPPQPLTPPSTRRAERAESQLSVTRTKDEGSLTSLQSSLTRDDLALVRQASSRVDSPRVVADSRGAPTLVVSADSGEDLTLMSEADNPPIGVPVGDAVFADRGDSAHLALVDGSEAVVARTEPEFGEEATGNDLSPAQRPTAERPHEATQKKSASTVGQAPGLFQRHQGKQQKKRGAAVDNIAGDGVNPAL